MKVLIICSGNSGNISPFISEQVTAIRSIGIQLEIYPIIGQGIIGYLSNLPKIKTKIRVFKPDIIHAHYSLSGLVACLQSSVPVVITFHGSDAYVPYVRILSKIAAHLSAYNIFVEDKIRNKIKSCKKNTLIPCGIDLALFFPMNKNIAKEKLGLEQDKKYILFSSSFDYEVKNYTLAKISLEKTNKQLNLIELKNKSREEVNLLLNACDLALLTSNSEGSPQFIKEAMACNCPIVSTDVGDVLWSIGETEGCYLVSFDPSDVAKKIKLALNFAEHKDRTNGRERIIELGLDSETVAKRIISIYEKVLNA
jgi:glycosyltransferase involved in cell wall biosynthesis